MAKAWYIVNVRSGRELFLHEMFAKAGFEVYTPFETRFQAPRSRKARTERQTPRPYAHPLYGGYLFVGSDMALEDSLMGMSYIIERRDDAYSFMVDRGAAVSITGRDMDNWRQGLREEIGGRKRVVLRGYDPRKDARKNQSRLYGQDIITLPKFTAGERVEFMSGGFQGLGAEITEVGPELVTVLATIFGTKREMKVDPYELRQAS